MRKLLDLIESINPTILVFAILCLNKLGWIMSGGEEQYLAYAKQFMNPEWIPNSFILTEFAGTRLIFQMIVGSLLYLFNFQTTATIGRLAIFAFTAKPLARIFKQLKVSNTLLIIVLQLFIMGKQSLFGFEWIFGGVEPKTVSYIFVFWALHYLIDHRFLKSYIFSAIAMYFHFLVGGWFFVAIVLYQFITERNIRNILTNLSIFTAIISPFVIYLYFGILKDSVDEINGVNLNWVYCYLRLPHHLGIFKTMDYFINSALSGVVVTALIFITNIIFSKYLKEVALPFINYFILISGSILLLFVGIAYIDKFYLSEGCRLFLKYYPFRLGSLFMFMTYVQGFLIVRHLLMKPNIYKKLIPFLVVIVLFLGIVRAINNYKNSRPSAMEADAYAMAEYINQNTPKESTIVLIGKRLNSKMYNSFLRRSERELFSVFKFTPTESEKIYEFYTRHIEQRKLHRNINHLTEMKTKYELDFLVANAPIKNQNLEEMAHHRSFHLYKIVD